MKQLMMIAQSIKYKMENNDKLKTIFYFCTIFFFEINVIAKHGTSLFQFINLHLTCFSLKKTFLIITSFSLFSHVSQ